MKHQCLKHRALCFIFLLFIFGNVAFSPQISFQKKQQTTATANVENELLWSFNTGGFVDSSPAIGDIDGDGDLDIVIGSWSRSGGNYCYALDGTTGTLLWSFKAGGFVDSSPAIGDIDGDGDLDVVFGSEDNRTYALDGRTGALLWSFETGDSVTSSPSLGDIDSDGDLDVVFGSRDNYVYALDGSTGNLLWANTTFTFRENMTFDNNSDYKKFYLMSIDNPIYRTAAIGDVDGDGDNDVVASGWYFIGVFDGASGNLLWSRVKGPDDWVFWGHPSPGYPALFDIDGDEGLDIIMGSIHSGVTFSHSKLFNGTTGEFEDSLEEDVLGYMYALQGATGAVIWNSKLAHGLSGPALGDINGDGLVDAVFGTFLGVIALDAYTGRIIWWQPIKRDENRLLRFFGFDEEFSAPTLGDINGDGVLDVAIGSGEPWVWGRIDILDGVTGAPLWSHDFPKGVFSSPILWDIDEDGDLDLIVGCEDGNVYAFELSTYPGRVFWQALSGTSTFSRTLNYDVIDPDHDFLSNYSESLYGTNPLVNDTDEDGMPDGWEVSNSLNPLLKESEGDLDNDGLTNLEEYRHKTNPLNPDTDNDGMPDAWEVKYRLDPLNDDGTRDPDGDTLPNFDEYGFGTNPRDSDSDGDGFSDGLELALSLNPLDASDVLLLQDVFLVLGLFSLGIGGYYTIKKVWLER